MAIVKLAERDSSDEHLHDELSGLCLRHLVRLSREQKATVFGLDLGRRIGRNERDRT